MYIYCFNFANLYIWTVHQLSDSILASVANVTSFSPHFTNCYTGGVTRFAGRAPTTLFLTCIRANTPYLLYTQHGMYMKFYSVLHVIFYILNFEQ